MQPVGRPFSNICTIASKINGTLKAQRCLLAHNNIMINYYGQVNSVRLKSSVASKWARKYLWGYHLFCC